MLINEQYISGVRDSVPTMLGYLSIGFACVVVSSTAGLTVTEIFLLSFLLYAGSAQFVVAAMVSTHTPASVVIFTVFFINLRHLLLSSSIVTRFDFLKPSQCFLVGCELTDENFALATIKSVKSGSLSFSWMLGANNSAHLSWILGNVSGGILGGLIPSPTSLGLDFALVAMFAGILVSHLESNHRLKKDLIIILCTVVSMIVFTFLNFSFLSVVMATIVGATVGMVITK